MRALTSAFVVLSALALSLPGTSRAAEPRDWTFLVFLNGDNDLDAYSDLNLNQMKKIGSTDKVDILVLRDRSTSETTKILHIEKDKATTVKDYGKNIDMGDWHQMVEFFKWSKENYPAKHFAYTMWDHGAGWGKKKRTAQPAGLRDISWDDHSGHYITTAQMAQALGEMKVVNGGKNIDIFGMDACLMQMAEIDAEIARSVDVVAASEETEPDEGWNYEPGLDFLTKNPTAAAHEVATKFEEAYVAANSDDVQGSAVSTAAVKAALPAIAAFVDELVTFDKLSKTELLSLMGDTQAFYMSDFKDLLDFVQRVKAKTVDSHMKGLASEAEVAVKASVHSNYTAGDSMAKAKGLSVWLPSEYQWSDRKDAYRALSFGKDSHWTKLLEALYGE